MTKSYKDYPHFYRMSRSEIRHAIKYADPSIFEECLDFLWDDPLLFGAGYIKAYIWRYIVRYELTPETLTRLEEAAIHNLKRPISVEFRRMCITMARIARPQFWETVRQEMASSNPIMSVTASCLFSYSHGVEAGEKYRAEHRRQWLPIHIREDYVRAPSIEQLLEILYEKDNWKNGEIIHKLLGPDEPSIVYFVSREDDLKFSRLDYTYCIPSVLLPKLDAVLDQGVIGWPMTSWLYSVNILKQVNSALAIPILIKFLQEKIDVKIFESPSKAFMSRTIFEALKRYGTAEAVDAIATRQHYV